MKLFMFAVPALMAPSLLLAQPPGGPGRRPPFPLMNALDADHDGVISAAEIRGAAARAASLDADKNGQLTAEELRPRMDVRRPGGPAPEAGGQGADPVDTFMAFDQNGDGALAKEEVPERMQGIFSRADANQDGRLTREELSKAAAARPTVPEPRGGGGHEDHGPGPRGGRGGGLPMDPLAAALDTDKDGNITAAEWKNASASLLKLDANKDGQLTLDEIRPGRGGFEGRGPRREEREQ